MGYDLLMDGLAVALVVLLAAIVFIMVSVFRRG